MMEIEKEMRKETRWKLNFGKNQLIFSAIEDSTNASDPEVKIIARDTEKDIEIVFDISKERFLNMSGIIDSFAQVSLGVEPVLPEEDYREQETRPATSSGDAKVTPTGSATASETAPPKDSGREIPPAASTSMPDVPEPATATVKPAGIDEEPVKAPTLPEPTHVDVGNAGAGAGERSTPPRPKPIAFPPRFPKIEEEPEDDEIVDPTIIDDDYEDEEDEDSPPEWNPW